MNFTLPIQLSSAWNSVSARATEVKKRWTPQDTKVLYVATKTFFEVGIAFTLCSGVAAFIAVPLSLSLATSMLAGSAVSLALDLSLYICRRIGWYGTSTNKELNVRTVQNAQWWADFSVVNLLGLSGPVIALHEAGHATAAIACFSGADPRITLMPFKGGVTQFDATAPLSHFGRMIGRSASMTLVAAGGLIATTLVATSCIMLANSLRESHPYLSRFLDLFGYAQLLADLAYGILGLTEASDKGSSDFRVLERMTGVHPVWIMCAIVTLPIAVKLFLNIDNTRKAQKAEKIDQLKSMVRRRLSEQRHRNDSCSSPQQERRQDDRQA